MRNPFSGGFSDRAEWQFKTCAKSDGSLYGTSDANQCRIGTETTKPKDEKAEKVKKILGASFKEYEATYGEARENIMSASAEAQTARILSDDYANKSVKDVRCEAAAESTVTVLNKMDQVRAVNPDLADKIGTNGNLFTAMKWDMVNDRALVTEGTLDEAWKGTDLNAKARDAFGTDSFGQSRTIVTEHPIPTHALKEKLYGDTSIRSREAVTREVINNSRFSYTTAKEDNRLNTGGFKSSMPDASRPMSRYERSEVKTFVLTEKASKGSVLNNLSKGAAKAQEKGMTKEQWIASIIDGMENM